MSVRHLHRPVRAARASAAALLIALAAACGGGGGGGGGGDQGGGGGPVDEDAVVFAGFTFKVNAGAPVSQPPSDDPSAGMIAGPLNTVVIFNFASADPDADAEAVPVGPFNQQTLPVYTTALDVAAPFAAGVSGGLLPAKGTYVPVGSTVEFRPFVPSGPVAQVLPAPSATVPGLLPGSTYTATVSLTSPKIPNLVGTQAGVSPSVEFDTTANEAAYFTGSSDGLPPQVVATDPPFGTFGFSPNPFSNVSLAEQAEDGDPTFDPDAPDEIVVSYDRALFPSEENASGTDLDGDGATDGQFFLRGRATELLVAHTVPVGAPLDPAPNTQAFPAISAFTEGVAPQTDGGDVVVHANPDGPVAGRAASPSLTSTPASIALAPDADLLYALLDGGADGGTDALTVVDHLIGDPSFAEIDPDAAVDTGIADLAGLTTLLDGRLVGWDGGERRLVELLPAVSRLRPTGAPGLESVALGDGTPGGGFLSEVFPAGWNLVALAQAPSGALWGLADADPSGGASRSAPVLVRLAIPDHDLDGTFESGDGLPVDGAPTITLPDEYVDVVFTEENGLLALNRATDSIDEIAINADLGIAVFLGARVSGVGATGVPLGGEPSPATSLALGHASFDVDVAFEPETAAGLFPVRVAPLGVLPIGAELRLHQRFTLADLLGISDRVATGAYALGSRNVLTLQTAEPLAGAAAVVDDLFLESFEDDDFEDATPVSLGPLAEWAEPNAAGVADDSLVSAAGVTAAPVLGDFAPLPNTDFDSDAQFNPSVNSMSPLFGKGTFRDVLLDTDAQNLPMTDGSTPDVTEAVTVFGGRFTFENFIIPEGVRVSVRGSQPLVITATKSVDIRGFLDCSGLNGADDISFDTGFTPVPAGAGGPGGGRGGVGQPTIFDPFFGGAPDRFATPEHAEHGFGPVLGPDGKVSFAPIGGRGGISTLGFEEGSAGAPTVLNLPATCNAMRNIPIVEAHRPPGGGGGSFWGRGQPAHYGTGVYRVQSFNNGKYNDPVQGFSLCPVKNKIQDGVYGAEEGNCPTGAAGATGGPALQCVYRTDDAFPAGSEPGVRPFIDGDVENDYIGDGGELPFVTGGQGGGGGGTRIDSLNHRLWSLNAFGAPVPGGTPCYPALAFGILVSPAAFDAKGGGGAGGGGGILIRSFGDIHVRRTGHIHARGGTGGGGEQVGNATFAAAGGSGSGGAIVLQASGEIVIEGDANHYRPHFTNSTFAQGACLDVSGGNQFKNDAKTDGDPDCLKVDKDLQWTLSDGGPGGIGMIQLQEGGDDGVPEVQLGAFLWGGMRPTIKLGPWIDDTLATPNSQAPHPNDDNTGELPVDLLEFRWIRYTPFSVSPSDNTQRDFFYLLNGSDPPVIAPGQPRMSEFQGDTPMMDYFGERVVKELQPERIVKTYTGETNPPGELYDEDDQIPFVAILSEPEGTLPIEDVDGVMRVPDRFLQDRLPVVPIGRAPNPISPRSRGTSRWLDFNGALLRARDAGVPPPFFAGIRGTHNPFTGAVPIGLEGHVIADVPAPGGAPAKLVSGAGPLDPGLFGDPSIPTNDIAVNAPDLLIDDAVPNNATVQLLFQGAYPVRAGSHVPDPSSQTGWVADLRELDGFPLVRFQVTFDLDANDDGGFGPGVSRAAADYVRLRPTY